MSMRQIVGLIIAAIVVVLIIIGLDAGYIVFPNDMAGW